MVKVALFGSPQFAIPVLQALYGKHELALVVTQPDKPVGRGMKLASPPAAEEAKKLGLNLEQPAKLKNNQAFHDRLQHLVLDVAVTAAYGKLLPPSLLEIPKHGFLNVHGSLLPKYRGAAPIQWALINGEHETGVSIMQTEAGLDTGPVRHVKRLEIQASDTALTLFDKLAALGAKAITEALELLAQNALPLIPQHDAEASLAPLLSKDDGRVRWPESAAAIYDRFRGVIAWPGSWTLFRGEMLKLQALEPVSGQGRAGQILTIQAAGVVVAAGHEAIRLLKVQMPGKASVTAYDWANGFHLKVGDSLG